MPRLRTTLAVSVLLLLLSVGATALLSSVQRLGDAVTLDPGARRPAAAPRVVRHPAHRSRPDARPEGAPTRDAIENVRAATPRVVTAPAPHYPIEALRRRRGGLVQVHVRLDAAGHVISATLEKSSGDPALDEAALKAARRWTFAMPPDARRELVLPIRFRIDTPPN